MKLIVDIPDEGYDWIKNGFPDNEDKEFLIKAIANGTPLPKGHGELIDRDKLSHIHRQMSYCSTAPNFIWVGELMKVTPIIEADKESDNETDN